MKLKKAALYHGEMDPKFRKGELVWYCTCGTRNIMFTNIEESISLEFKMTSPKSMITLTCSACKKSTDLCLEPLDAIEEVKIEQPIDEGSTNDE